MSIARTLLRASKGLDELIDPSAVKPASRVKPKIIQNNRNLPNPPRHRGRVQEAPDVRVFGSGSAGEISDAGNVVSGANILTPGSMVQRANFNQVPGALAPGANARQARLSEEALGYNPAPLSKKEALAAKNYEPSGKNLEYGPDPMMHIGLAKSQLGVDPLPRPQGSLSAPTPAGAPMHGPVSLKDYNTYVGATEDLQPLGAPKGEGMVQKLSPFESGSLLERKYVESLDDSSTFGVYREDIPALASANQRILEAEETGSVVGLLRRQNELYNQGRVRGSIDGTVPEAGTPQGLEYGLLGNQIDKMERASYLGPGGYGPMAPHRSQEATRRLYSGDAYNESVHMRNNNATSTNAMNGGTSGPTPPPSSNAPVNPTTTPTGSTDYSGLYVPSQGNTASSVSALDMINESGGAGIMASVGLGAILGGSANYAMGGEFGEGAVMGGLAGGAMKIGARAIQANETSIENYLQRTALGDQFTSGMTREQAGRAIQDMSEAPEGLMRGMAYNVLRSEAPSVGMQSRYAVMGGSMLSGVAFTGRRNDKRRGFNAHRGNRI